MLIAFYSNAQDNVPRVQDTSWPELVQLLTTFAPSGCTPCAGHRCPAKLHQRAWSPVDISERRRTENVRSVTVAVFDLDGVTDAQLQAVAEKLEGYAAIVHSTHTHRPGCTSLRVILPLSRPALPREWPLVREAAVRLLCIPADPATKDLARLYFLPNSSGEHETFSDVAEGRALDVDALLAAARAGLAASAPAPSPAPLPDPGGPADLYEMRALLRRVRKPEHREIVRRVLAGEPLAQRGAQDNTLNELMSCCAFVLPVEAPEDAILEIFRPSFSATDWGEGLEHLCEQARLKLQRHRERRKARDAESLRENQEIWAALTGKRREAATPAAATPVVEEGEEDPESWVKELVLVDTKDGQRIKNCEANVYTVLAASPEWRGCLRFNEVTKELELSGGPLRQGVNLDGLDAEIAVWMQKSEYGKLGLMPKPGTVREVLRQVAHGNAYDPLAEYLNGLVWDGTPRADTFLETYFGAQGDTAHLRAISPKFLIGAVARALRPGCKVDTMLILEGTQGLRKSTSLRELAGEFFCDAPIDINSKDSVALASQKWIIEFAELEPLKRASGMEQLKAFLSRSEDTYRPPYGRVNVKAARRCVFVGTTNLSEYLRNDPSGYRRFWPVLCTAIDYAGLARDRAQLWAEAVFRFKQGEKWWLSEAEGAHAELQAAQRSEDTGGHEEVVLQWLLRLAPEARPAELTTDRVAADALQILTPGQVTHAVRIGVGRTLKALGFERKQRWLAGVPRWVYVTPESLRTASAMPAGARPGPLHVVANSPAR